MWDCIGEVWRACDCARRQLFLRASVMKICKNWPLRAVIKCALQKRRRSVSRKTRDRPDGKQPACVERWPAINMMEQAVYAHHISSSIFGTPRGFQWRPLEWHGKIYRWPIHYMSSGCLSTWENTFIYDGIYIETSYAHKRLNRYQVGVRMSRSSRGNVLSTMSRPTYWIQRYIRTYISSWGWIRNLSSG